MDIAYDLLYAALIGATIGLMAIIKNPHTKALIYSLPLPITLALLATNAHIDARNLIGLALVIIFLWMTYWLYAVRKAHIIVADITSAGMYVVIGFLVARLPLPNFEMITGLYMIMWACFMVYYRETPADQTAKPDPISPLTKAAGSGILAFVLLSIKHLLAGIVVTFPFNGVFAVIESRHTLATMAAVVTRNSPAVLALFATSYYLPYSMNIFLKTAISWITYLFVLYILMRFAPIRQARAQIKD